MKLKFHSFNDIVEYIAKAEMKRERGSDILVITGFIMHPQDYTDFLLKDRTTQYFPVSPPNEYCGFKIRIDKSVKEGEVEFTTRYI